MPHPVIDAANRYKQALLNRDASQINTLVQAYGRGYQQLIHNVQALEDRLTSYQDQGITPSRAQLMRLSSLRSLIAQTEAEINRFSVYADQSIAQAVSQEVVEALRDSRNVLEAYFSSRSGKMTLRASWELLPAESVETLIGMTGTSSPLRMTLVNRLGPTVAEHMGNALVDGILLGMNPRKVAQLVRSEYGIGLTWAMTTARTAHLWSYREATRASYIANSHIIDSWTWYATLGSNRTCLSCIAKHGSVHPITETLNDHHNGRCVPLPNIKNPGKFGLSLPMVEAGERWFSNLPVSTQVEYMGPSMYNAWQADEFRFDELSMPYQDPVYGDMVREASLTGLLGQRAQRYYVTNTN